MDNIFTSFVESLRDSDPALIEAVMEGFATIFEDAFHKESSILNMFVNTRNDKTRTIAPTTWIWEGHNTWGELEDAGTVMALDYNDAIRRVVYDLKERRIPWMQFDTIQLRRK